jgi:hypothetical protein
MPALSFQKQFCPKVRRGEKTHSIRAKRARPWKVGDKVALYYAMRTKQCTLLGRSTVVKVDDIVLTDGEKFDIRINGELLAADEAESFARRDGFDCLRAMADFWRKNYSIHISVSWSGDIIHWKFPFDEEGIEEKP